MRGKEKIQRATAILGWVAAGLLPMAGPRTLDYAGHTYANEVGHKELMEREKRQQLEAYLREISDEFLRNHEIVSSRLLFEGFKALTLEQQVDDFERYFPIYYAVQLEYGVPWEMMWVAHVQETTASREEIDPWREVLYAMQRHTGFYTEEDVAAALGEYDFLTLWEGQRYTPELEDVPTTDAEEIIWAGSKMNADAERRMGYMDIDWIRAVELAQYSYCADFCAHHRIEQFRKVRQLMAEAELQLRTGWRRE